MKIMVATDGSRGSAAALTFAARLACEDPESELVVLTVAPANRAGAAATGGGDSDPEPRRVAQKILDRAARSIGRRGAAARFQLVTARRQDEIPEAISREADRLKADLVVVGSEARDTLSEWVVGGTALRLIYVAQRPVTVVRAPRSRKAG